mmetsp:Transcript_17744/g.55034  ORF Transcript_17744/g.55034 Transcript_17744/m.55034 type:complete len:279 (-) Transcript_17744:540-1376(-)
MRPLSVLVGTDGVSEGISMLRLRSVAALAFLVRPCAPLALLARRTVVALRRLLLVVTGGIRVLRARLRRRDRGEVSLSVFLRRSLVVILAATPPVAARVLFGGLRVGGCRLCGLGGVAGFAIALLVALPVTFPTSSFATAAPFTSAPTTAATSTPTSGASFVSRRRLICRRSLCVTLATLLLLLLLLLLRHAIHATSAVLLLQLVLRGLLLLAVPVVRILLLVVMRMAAVVVKPTAAAATAAPATATAAPSAAAPAPAGERAGGGEPGRPLRDPPDAL